MNCTDNETIASVKIEITESSLTGDCTGELPIKPHNGILSRAFFDREFLVKLVMGCFLIVVIIGGIIPVIR